jgi:hypothetical protein
MASKAEAIAFIKSSYDKAEEFGDGLFKVTFATTDDRSQMVFFGVEETLIWVSSPFASVGSITPAQAIAVAEDYIYGIGKDDDHYCVKHVIYLPDLDASELFGGVERVKDVADKLERALGLGDNL